MKRLVASVAMLSVIAGCKKEPSPPAGSGQVAPAAQNTAPVGGMPTLESARQNPAGALGKAMSAMDEVKEQVSSGAQKQLDEVKAEIDRFKANHPTMTADAKTAMDKLESAASTAREKIVKLKDSSSPMVKSAADEVAKAMDKLKDAYNEAKTKLGG